MIDDLLKLYKLQKVDYEIYRMEKNKEAETKILHDLTVKKEEQKKIFEESLNAIKDLEKEKRKLDGELAQEEDNIKKSQNKMYELKTNEEYQAFLKEIEKKKYNKTSIEDKVLENIEKYEQELSIKKQKEDQLKELDAEYKILEEKINTFLADAQKEIETLLNNRNELAKDINKYILNRYNEIKAKRDEHVLVKVKNGVCEGCFMGIPPQMYNELFRADKIMSCPNCQRFIYHHEVNLE
jgi:predicted  nucleic acid-binding Zn-ribbon protein